MLQDKRQKMPKEDEIKVSLTTIPDRICKIQLPRDDLINHHIDQFHYRLNLRSNPRTSDTMAKKLIMRSLESILDKCLKLKLLPLTIIKQLTPLKARIASVHDDTASESVRCKKFSKILTYAQLILC